VERLQGKRARVIVAIIGRKHGNKLIVEGEEFLL